MMKPARQKKRPAFSLARKDEPMAALVRETDKKILAVWAVDCASRVLPFFEEQCPDDPRPRIALDTCRAWIRSGEFRMATIRESSLASHAAARNAGEDTPARSAARASGQAVATVHVPAHSLAAAAYAQQAVFFAAHASDAEAAVKKERDWQYMHLLGLTGSEKPQNCRAAKLRKAKENPA